MDVFTSRLEKREPFTPELELRATLDDEFFDVDNCDDLLVKPSNKESNDDQPVFSLLHSASQPGYYGPIHMIVNRQNRSDADKSIDYQPQCFMDPSSASTAPTKYTIDDIIELTSDVRHMIEALHEDVLFLKVNPTPKSEDLSIEEHNVIKILTQNLTEVIRTARNENRSELVHNLHPVKTYGTIDVSPLVFTTQNVYLQGSNYIDINAMENRSETIPNETEDSSGLQIHHPNCVNVLTLNSSMPRVPTKTSLVAINDGEELDDDVTSFDNHVSISTVEQFENIPTRDERKNNRMFILKQHSFAYKNEQTDWPNYSSKSNYFSDLLRSNLPILQSEDRNSSFKQIPFDPQNRKLPSTSANTSRELCINSDELRMSKTMKQRTFRVRKSRLIISFDDLQQNAGDSKNNDVDNFIHTTRDNQTPKMNFAYSNNEQEAQQTNNSNLSLFQTCRSPVDKDELLLLRTDKPVCHDICEYDESSSEMSNGLYSVTSQIFLP
ncbi:unnamed protein product [Adineta ricciae]|uniref:Uncharacterized protein n=1 Tax=Adineta ricciae TaxID=249248 RepID=A0A814Z4M9_ADIRI|nr:unnamed protein product [Adineta ricciae]